MGYTINNKSFTIVILKLLLKYISQRPFRSSLRNSTYLNLSFLTGDCPSGNSCCLSSNSGDGGNPASSHSSDSVDQ